MTDAIDSEARFARAERAVRAIAGHPAMPPEGTSLLLLHLALLAEVPTNLRRVAMQAMLGTMASAIERADRIPAGERQDLRGELLAAAHGLSGA